MTDSKFNLLVIRSTDAPRAVDFYKVLGMQFVQHSHGNGPEHYAHESEGFVFEIYPLDDKATPTSCTRLGFKVDSLDQIIDRLEAVGGSLVSPPNNSPWGKRAVVSDLDGHKVELVEAEAVSA